MAELAGDPESSPHDGALEEDRPADPRPHRERHRVGLVAGRPEPALRPARSVRVVVDDDRHLDATSERLPQRFVSPGEMRRKDHGRPVGADETRSTDPHRNDLGTAHLRKQIRGDPDDDVLNDTRARRSVRGEGARPGEHGPISGDDATRDLRPADVDSQGVTGPRIGHPANFS